MVSETILRERSVAACAVPGSRVEHVHSLGPARIALPRLQTGASFFDHWPVREVPEQGLWAADHYDSFAPPTFVLHDVLVHSSAGIVAVGDTVIAETLAHTNGHDHAYRPLMRGIAISPEHVTKLPGAHISLLAAGEMEYRHAMLHGLARLISVPETYQVAAEGVLVPAGGPFQAETLRLLDLLPSLAVREVEQAETLHVETLIFPLSVCGEAAYHPCLLDFFRRLSANVAAVPGRPPRRIYIDHRASPIRPLHNESDVIAGLAPLGFCVVRPDEMNVAEQIRLFRQAEAVVSPNGAWLANLGFCRPGCVVVELQMDAFVDWGFRHLAALAQLRYDCVLGRAPKPWGDLDAYFHGTPWEISVQHVVAAVAHALRGSEVGGALAA